ncbi:hypothetical protein [Virgibacillus halodenitrificans]|uniref:hypothetical protein n=1 Tax=Virgibacillus halodenitrificans TaxID=1482 RepID=UPI002DBB1999|nr:hypothetical protein [Virgibacillus halodenitrificans]MEC2158800.1 hypothetical protein [Virgibacillus halodenitrificans]
MEIYKDIYFFYCRPKPRSQHQPTADLIGEILTASLITTGLWWLMDIKPSEKKEEFE